LRILVIVGSRTPEGQTGRAAAAWAEGARSAGAEAEAVYLPGLRLERCRQCDADGWGLCRDRGRCAIDDDFAGLIERARAADGLAFATPVYFSDLSESLRAFLDRFRRVARLEAHSAGVRGKRAAGIAVAGGGGGGAPEATAALAKILGNLRIDLVDVHALRRQNLEGRLGQLRLAGEWFVKSAAT